MTTEGNLMETALTIKGKTKEVEVEALAIIDEAQTMVIIDDTDFAIAGNLLLGIKDLRKKIAETFDPIISKTYQAHKEACSQKKKTEIPLLQAENIINPKMGAYRIKQEQERQAEIRRQEAAAKKAMDDAKLQDALESELNGDPAEGMAIINDDLFPVPTPKVEKPVTPEGVVFRDNWYFEILDAVKIPRMYLIPNEKLIGAIVRQTKDKDKAEQMIPDIRVWVEKKAGRGR